MQSKKTDTSALYTVKEYNEKNRVLLAAQDIQEAQVIMEVKPMAWAVISSLRNAFCNYCLEKKHELRKCSVCSTLYYCSVECQRADWTVHKQECKAYAKITKIKNFKITSEFILLARCYLAYRSNSSVQKAIKELLDLNDYQPEEKRLYFRDMAVCLVENFEYEKSVDTIGLLVSLANKIAINTFTIQDYLFDYEGIAIGLYHPANFMNHSCRPNAVQIFDGVILRILALHTIEKDEEINISYIDELLNLNERKSLLKQAYLFDCGCYQCIAEKAVKIQYLSLLCECEKGNLQLVKESTDSKCNSCSKVYSEGRVSEIRQQIKKYKSQLTNEKGTYENMIKVFFALKKLLRFQDPFFSKVLQNLYLAALRKVGETQDIVKQDKLYQDAYKLLKTIVQNFKSWYHMEEGQEFHVLLMWKLSELGKLAMHLGKVKKAVLHTEKAVEMLKKCKLNPKLQEVKELIQRNQRLQIECRMNVSGKP